jgi:hypothetical protein
MAVAVFEKNGFRISVGVEAGMVTLESEEGRTVTFTPDEARQIAGGIEEAISEARTQQHEADADAAHG